MPRTANDIGTPSTQKWPDAGWCDATCIKVEKWVSPKKKTPAVMLGFMTTDGEYQFDDPVFVTIKAMPRMNLVAQRLCGMPKDTVLPDDDKEAISFLAKYIMNNALHRAVRLDITVSTETFIYEHGDKIGQKGTMERHKVAFAGYESLQDAPAPMPQAPPAMPAQNTPQGPPTDYDGEPINEPPSGPDIPF